MINVYMNTVGSISDIIQKDPESLRSEPIILAYCPEHNIEVRLINIWGSFYVSVVSIGKPVVEIDVEQVYKDTVDSIFAEICRKYFGKDFKSLSYAQYIKDKEQDQADNTAIKEAEDFVRRMSKIRLSENGRRKLHQVLLAI